MLGLKSNPPSTPIPAAMAPGKHKAPPASRRVEPQREPCPENRPRPACVSGPTGSPSAPKGNPAEPQPIKDEILRNLKKLYPMPHVLFKARRMLADPETNLQEIGRLLKADPALAGRILRVANSAYFGWRGNVHSIERAAVLLGTKTLTQALVLVCHSRRLGAKISGYGYDAGDLWRHSLAVAVGGELLAQATGYADPEMAFMAGLMHDAGKIILDRYVQQRREAFQDFIAGDPRLVVYGEQKVLGFDHAQIGSELCRKWDLSPEMAAAIAGHHFPGGTKANALAYILYVADQLAHGVFPFDPAAPPPTLERGALKFLELTAEEGRLLSVQIHDKVEELEEDTY